ncbi:MAG: hypothetical protein AAB728_06055, partial [Patescibacteria group bacterium]
MTVPSPAAHRAPLRSASFLLAVLCAVLGEMASVHAQEATHVQEEQVNLFAGDVLEVLGTHDQSGTQFTWILEKDGAFLQAAHLPLFRSRLTDPGTYRLDATAASADGVPLAQRVLVLEVRARPAATGEESSAAAADLVSTDPLPANGTLTLTANRRFLRLVPVQQGIAHIILDIDAAVDRDGNGNARDDDDAADTFFRSARVPLFVWLPSPRAEREMQLTALRNDGTAAEQTLRITQNSEAAPSLPTIPQDS